MQTNRLTIISKYRGTLFIGIILLIIAILAGIIKTSSDSLPPVSVQTTQLKSSLPGTLTPKWENLTLGTSKEKIIEYFGKPLSEETKDNRTTLLFKSSDMTPLLKHSVVFINNKAVRVSRAIIDYQENLDKAYFDNKYGVGKQIRSYESEENGSLYSYNTIDYMTVIESINVTNSIISRVISMTKDEYSYFLENDAKIKIEDSHHFGEKDFQP